MIDVIQTKPLSKMVRNFGKKSKNKEKTIKKRKFFLINLKLSKIKFKFRILWPFIA